jgi:hypothetical protein
MFKRIGAEAILTAIIVPVSFWFATFIISAYETRAEVSDLKNDILEIKQDTKYIRNYLLERK